VSATATNVWVILGAELLPGTCAPSGMLCRGATLKAACSTLAEVTSCALVSSRSSGCLVAKYPRGSTGRGEAGEPAIAGMESPAGAAT
jgi:hypothetical protein